MDGRTFELERITALWAELEPLATVHLVEIGDRLPLRMNREGYTRAEEAGVHLFHTARINGELIGYCSTILSRCPFTSVTVAHEDGIYVTPPHRGYVGRDLEHWVDTMLTTRGVYRSFRERIVEGCQADRALRRGPLGYRPHSVLFVRDLPVPAAEV